MLQLAAGTPVWEFVTVSEVEGQPVSLSQVYFRKDASKMPKQGRKLADIGSTANSTTFRSAGYEQAFWASQQPTHYPEIPAPIEVGPSSRASTKPGAIQGDGSGYRTDATNPTSEPDDGVLDVH